MRHLAVKYQEMQVTDRANMVSSHILKSILTGDIDIGIIIRHYKVLLSDIDCILTVTNTENFVLGCHNSHLIWRLAATSPRLYDRLQLQHE
jgi:hypothetical protein